MTSVPTCSAQTHLHYAPAHCGPFPAHLPGGSLQTTHHARVDVLTDPRGYTYPRSALSLLEGRANVVTLQHNLGCRAPTRARGVRRQTFSPGETLGGAALPVANGTVAASRSIRLVLPSCGKKTRSKGGRLHTPPGHPLYKYMRTHKPSAQTLPQNQHHARSASQVARTSYGEWFAY